MLSVKKMSMAIQDESTVDALRTGKTRLMTLRLSRQALIWVTVLL